MSSFGVARFAAMRACRHVSSRTGWLAVQDAVPSIGVWRHAPRRGFSTTKLPVPLTMDAVLTVGEVVLLYLDRGTPGAELEKLRENHARESTATRQRKMLQTYVNSQLHTALLLGFKPTAEGLQQYARSNQEALMKAMSSGSQDEKDLLQELHSIQHQHWQIMLRKGFGVDEIPLILPDNLRYAASKVSSKMQEPKFLKEIGELYEKELKVLASSSTAEVAGDRLQQKIIDDCFMPVLPSVDALPKDPVQGAVVLSTLFTLNMNDPEIQGNLIAGYTAITKRAPMIGSAPGL